MRARLVSLQYLRGFAAFAVMLLHLSEASGLGFHWGGAGVDVFFVISGFVMWFVTTDRTTPAGFLGNRIARVVPLYWLTTLVVAVKNHASLAELGRSLLFVPYRRPGGEIFPVLLPGWTLNLEMFFYALFAVALFLSPRWRLLFLTVTLTALAAAGAVLKPASAPGELYTSAMVMEFLAGIWLCRFYKAESLFGPRASLALILAAFTAMAVNGTSPEHLLRVAAWGLPALAIVTGFLGLEVAGRLPDWPLLQKLGDSSYSLYLTHTIVMSIMLKLLGTSLLILILGIPICLAVGWGCYWLVERRLTDGVRNLSALFAPSRRDAPAET